MLPDMNVAMVSIHLKTITCNRDSEFVCWNK